jgi:membrane-associated phospholipid phosphatase
LSNRIATVLSYLFFPGLIPVYLTGLLFGITPYIAGLGEIHIYYRLMILGFIALYSFIFPALFTYWLYKRNVIRNLELTYLSDRKLPYASAVIFLLFLAYTFYYKSPELIPTSIILFSIALVVLIIGLISLFWQVSAHAAGMGGLVGSIGSLMLIYDEPLLKIPFFIILFLAGLVISARLKLGAHTPAQTYVGFGIGWLVSSIGSFFV